MSRSRKKLAWWLVFVVNVVAVPAQSSSGSGWTEVQSADALGKESAAAATGIMQKMNDDLIFSSGATTRKIVSASHHQATDAMVKTQ